MQIAKECPYGSAVSVNRLRGEFSLLRLIEWMVTKLMRILKADNKAS
jgi:hypothetical protein